MIIADPAKWNQSLELAVEGSGHFPLNFPELALTTLLSIENSTERIELEFEPAGVEPSPDPIVALVLIGICVFLILLFATSASSR